MGGDRTIFIGVQLDRERIVQLNGLRKDMKAFAIDRSGSAELGVLPKRDASFGNRELNSPLIALLIYTK